MFFKSFITFFLIVISLFLVRFPVQCQASSDSLRIIRMDKNLIEVQYDLEATEPGLRFSVIPYYIDSLGNKIQIHKVSGEIGEGVAAGINKTFVWEFARELTQYFGTMQIAIEKDTLSPQASIILPKEHYRRTAKVKLKMENTGSTAHYEVIDPNRQIISQGKLKKKQEAWQLTLPNILSRSEKYRIRVWNRQGIPAYSTEFSVRRKFPLSTQIGGTALVVGGVLYLIICPGCPEDPLPSPFEIPDGGK